MAPINQQELLAALGNANIDAPVKMLYEHFFEGIVSQITFQGGTRDDGADIFQEAVLILINKVRNKQFRGDSSLKTFLSGIARNLWLSEMRSQGRREQREKAYMNQAGTHEMPGRAGYDNDFDMLNKLIGQLGDTCRKILTGFYYEEKSIKEMLHQFNYENEQVLRNRKSKCMKHLKETLKNNIHLLNNIKTHLLYEQ
ncbi:MAG: sigma-70 family RNA polymerase sigma factor [Dinghuibacter sp.]|nr:sigma-70 family RNA polymerase sigma factor [Dinghuibacter sp.]